MTSSTADCVTERNTSDGDENCASLAKSTRQRGGSGSGSGSGSGGGGGGGGGVGDETARGARQTASRRGQTSSPPPPTVPGSNDGMEDRRKTAATATTAAAPPIPTWSALPVLYTPSRLDRSAGVAFGTGSPCVHAGNRAPTNNHDNSIHEDEDEDGDVGRCSMSALESPTCCGGQSKNSIDTTTIADAISTRDHKSGSDTNRTGCQDDTSADVACRADVPDGGADARSGRGDARTCHLCLHVQETKEKPTRRGRTWRYSPMAHDVAATTSDGDCQLHCHDLCDASRRNDVLLQQSTRLLLERRRTAQSRNLQNRFEEYARTRCGSRLVRLLTADERLLTEREIELQQQQHGHGHESPSHDDARLSSGVDGYLHGSVLSRTRTCAPPANLTVMQSECAALRSQIHRQRAALYDNFHAWYASLLSNDRQGSAESTVNANEDMDHDERVKKKPVMIIT